MTTATPRSRLQRALGIPWSCLTRRERALRYAAGIAETVHRHRIGCIAHGTMRKHVDALWRIVEAQGLTRLVREALQ